LIDLERAALELGSPPSSLFVCGMNDVLLIAVEGIDGFPHVVGGVAGLFRLVHVYSVFGIAVVPDIAYSILPLSAF
jgi:hypothetical protein